MEEWKIIQQVNGEVNFILCGILLDWQSKDQDNLPVEDTCVAQKKLEEFLNEIFKCRILSVNNLEGIQMPIDTLVACLQLKTDILCFKVQLYFHFRYL